WIFVPTGVLAVGLFVVALARLPDSSAPEGRRMDWPGQITATVGIAVGIYGVIEGGQAGWDAPQTIAGLAIGAISLVAFVWVEARSSSPLMRLDLYRSPEF